MTLHTDWDAAGGGTEISSGFEPAFDLPRDLVRMAERLGSRMDRRLGYGGEARFVSFRYEPRADEVFWDDGRTCGFGSGGWQTFIYEIIPLADYYDMNVGRGGCESRDVLLLDREFGTAYFGQRDVAKRFLARQQAK